jgi:predicted ATPase/DNA-binding XRE family transcriptional regulator
MPKDQDYSFGAWIGRRRKSLDLTQPEMAERLHCSLDTIKKVETDARRPSKQLAELLAVQLNIPQEHRALFIECARGIRSVDVLQRLEGNPSTELNYSTTRLKPDLRHISFPSIIGRETELDTLKRLMNEARLVTITGPGGMGKSTLAQAVMADFQAHGITCAFISLIELRSADQIPLTVASTLGLMVEADPKQQTLNYLRSRKALLVFDNFEHLLEGASFIDDIRQHTTNVIILITSRERLGLSGEQVFPLQGLLYPENFVSGDRQAYPAIELFLASARRLIPDFEPTNPEIILQICHITEGMPLALEMAASWVDTLSLTEIVEELNRNPDILAQDHRQVASRHRSMRVVFDSSWQLLNKAERGAFSKLCIFRGGFTRQAAETVAGAAAAILAALVRRSMIKLNPASGRYSIHELLRLYGEEHLKASGAFQQIQTRHLDYFLQMAETMHKYLHTRDQMEWFDRLDAEQDNIRMALSWSLSDSEHTETAVRLILALCWHWRIRSHVVEGRQWVERALEANPSSSELRAGLHFHAGHFGWMQFDIDFARSHHQASLGLWQSVGKAGIRGAAYVHHALGMIADVEKDSATSNNEFQRSVSLFEECQDRWGLSFVRMHLGVNIMWAGDLDTAADYLRKSEKYFRECGDDWALGLLLGFYGWMEFQRGNLVKAESMAKEAFAIRERLRHIHSLIDSIELLARIAIEQGDKEKARQFFETAIEISDELGNQQFLMDFKKRLAELSE